MLSFVAFSTAAQDLPAKSIEAVPTRSIETFLLLGSTFATKSNSKATFLGKTFESESYGKGDFAVGLDIGFKITNQFYLCFDIDQTTYQYTEPNSSPDRILFIGLAPKLRLETGLRGISAWGSVALGLARETVSGAEIISDGIMITLQPTTANSFAYSPRFGFDFALTRVFSLRLQVSYTEATNFSYISNVKNYPALTNVGTIDHNVRQSWFTGALGLMWGFN